MQSVPVPKGLLLFSVAAIAAGMPLRARANDPFEYKLKVTPEEEQVDPVIDKRYTPQFAACQERARTMPENAACFETEFARQDATLNRTWRVTLGGTPTATKSALRAAQRKWIASRDPFCRSSIDSLGSIAPVAYAKLPRRTHDPWDHLARTPTLNPIQSRHASAPGIAATGDVRPEATVQANAETMMGAATITATWAATTSQ